MTTSNLPLISSRSSALTGWSDLAKTKGSLESAGLTAALRYRLFHEGEACESLLAEHKPATVEAQLKDLCVRTYWRGWSESRPQIYLSFLRSCEDDRRRFQGTQALAAALEGRTGLAAFDEWNREMLETGFLPQQARLWYASIWIFTLRLPWSLGAAHAAEHLIDADPAGQVLLWRWVAGLHLAPKPFVARAADISKWSKGRFDLTGHLNESPVALTGPALPPALFHDLPQEPSDVLGENFALLVTPDDLCPEASSISGLKPKLILTTSFENLNKACRFGPKVQEYVGEALADTKQRLEQHYGCRVEALNSSEDPGELIGQRLAAEGLSHLLYHQPATGPWHELLARVTAKDVGLKYFPLRRPWDSRLWPSATRTQLDFHEAAKPRLLKTKGQL